MKHNPFEKGLVIALTATIIVGAIIFVSRVLLGDLFTKEEAQHGLYGLWIFKDLITFDIKSFLYDTQRQLMWPFLHSWALSGFFFIFGANAVSARLMSMVFFLFTVILTYLMMSHFARDYGEKPGLIAIALALTSPLMVQYASQNMLEAMGALLFLAAAYTYMLCEEKKITLEYVLLALLIGLSIYTNYLFAFLMVVAFMVVTLSKLVPVYFGAIKLSHKGEKAAIHFIWWAYRKLIVLLVLLFLVTAWFSFNFSRKILILTAAIFKYNGGEQVLGLWPSLFYYPKAIITQASFSPWLGLLLLISIFLPFVMSRFVEVHHLFIIVWTVLLLLTAVVPAKSGQLVYIILPFIFIIFSTGLFYIKEKLQDKNPKLVFWLLLLVFVPALFSLPQLANLWFPSYPGATMQQVIGFYKESTPQDTIMVIPLNLLRLNPEVVEFYLSDRKGAIITDTSQIGPKVEGKKKYFLTLEIDDNSKYKTETLDDSLLLWNQALQQKLEQGQIKLFLTRRFDNIGISAMIYEEI